MTEHRQRPLASTLASGLLCRCPACGKGRLFSGYLTLAPACNHCGLKYDFADAGDGPAVFVILVTGFSFAGYVANRKILYGAASLGFLDALEEERSVQGALGVTPDHLEGMRAFIEKRPAKFGSSPERTGR